MANNTISFTMTLEDAGESDGTLHVLVKGSSSGIFISMEGYGDKTSLSGHGEPLMLELYNGQPRVYAWADINQEDPTHTIDMGGAAESFRQEETDA